jgi:hypothetical protein
MTLIDKACYERGCACYDPRVDLDNIEVVQREWVGLTDDERLEVAEIDGADEWFWKVCKAIEAKLKEKNT